MDSSGYVYWSNDLLGIRFWADCLNNCGGGGDILLLLLLLPPPPPPLLLLLHVLQS